MTSPARAYHHGDLRRALIDEGLTLARTGGPVAVTLREATRAVGVSPNAAYRHFADRDTLVHAVAREAQLALAGQAAGLANMTGQCKRDRSAARG
jgi:AcrR family transcriptional regulator